MQIAEPNEISATTSSPSEAARVRLLSRRGEPLLLADWLRVLMIHFEVDADELQRDTPYRLDLRDGRAFVSLVAFTMEQMRPRAGGSIGAWLFLPIATHDFLNVRTYVRHNGEPGIHFLAEWLSNRLAVRLGPRTFGLPYHHGRICYEHNGRSGVLRGRVADSKSGSCFIYDAELKTLATREFTPCECGSLDEWLMERYAAFNSAWGAKRFFRIWHPPWPQRKAEFTLKENSLLRRNWPWFEHARLIGANYSPGIQGVWMGRPHLL